MHIQASRIYVYSTGCRLHINVPCAKLKMYAGANYIQISVNVAPLLNIQRLKTLNLRTNWNFAKRRYHHTAELHTHHLCIKRPVINCSITIAYDCTLCYTQVKHYVAYDCTLCYIREVYMFPWKR